MPAPNTNPMTSPDDDGPNVHQLLLTE